MKTSVKFLALAMSSALMMTSMQASAQQDQARELARAAAVEAAKASGKKDKVSYEEPARSYFNWGGIVRPDGEIVSVRAGSVAANMGIQPGDKLLKVNGNKVAGNSLNEMLAPLDSLQHGEAFTVTVERAGSERQFAGEAKATVIPGWRLEVDVAMDEQQVGTIDSEGCGRVSVFFTPPVTRDYYPAFINSVDGESVRVRNPNVVLSAGEHTIGVHELIDDRSVRRSQSLDKEKELQLTVEPNTTYYIAAHFIREQRFDRINQGYWEPIVWKVTEQECTVE
ncbi:PDZ domain-containing protein [Pseudidiomarina sp.]|uniref:PDZ domain-containing protein n=1 Tax=Pseudidiomarina sp. TaxID=2081707 RepID=UPI00299E08E1|nr:PDZ domain-containing protein [Pseudidiomarina sp.]MDX1706415.1 PDZ domain-containing protein [Pseudidiomarina sp.]